jgi:hypothetical protein
VFNIGLTAALVCHVVATALPHFPVFQRLRDIGLATYGTLLLWCIAVSVLWFSTADETRSKSGEPDAPALAA